MKNKAKEPRKRLVISMSKEEYDQVVQTYSKSTCRSLNSYAKKTVLGIPTTIFYRNKSFDEFTESYIAFKKDLDNLLLQGGLTNEDKDWLIGEIKSIKGIVNKLYDHVCQANTHGQSPMGASL